MKQKLMRPTAALFPIVGIVGAVWGNSNYVIGLYISYYLMQLFSLCAIDCFRNAAAQEPGVRKVDQRFSGTFLMMIVGAAITGLLWKFVLSQQGIISVWKVTVIAAALVCIEHVFEERMYALGRRIDGVILSCVTNGLLLTGLLLNAGWALIAGAGLGALIAIITCYAIEPIHGFSLKPANFEHVPLAVLQTLLYIAVTAAMTAVTGVRISRMLLPALFGLISWRLARTPCRRTEDESRPLNLLLISIAAIATAASAGYYLIQPFALTACVALLCAAIVYCAPSERLCAGIVLIAAAFLTPLAISIILAVAAILLNVKKAFLKKV